MSYGDEGFRPTEYTMADRASAEDRGAFLMKTYLHLLGAIAVFVALEIVLIPTIGESFTNLVFMRGQMGWLVVLGAFMAVSWVANSMAHSGASKGAQYMGLGLYVLAQAFIFVPLLWVASRMSEQSAMGGTGVIGSAGLATTFIFCGLTAVVFITRKNFGFLGPILGILSMCALALIVCSILFGFHMGTIFTVAMIGLAAGYILYSTSNVLHEYPTDQYVAASLALFASVALLFWYILQLFMSRD